jgi:hypothetical protein
MISRSEAAYVDTSCVLAVLLGERLDERTQELLDRHTELFSSNLLEAEVRSVLARRGVAAEPTFLDEINWVFPNRPLTPEIQRGLAHGYLRGADAWHIASALYLAEVPATLSFLTLDHRQRDVASALGFPTPLQPVLP